MQNRNKLIFKYLLIGIFILNTGLTTAANSLPDLLSGPKEARVSVFQELLPFAINLNESTKEVKISTDKYDYSNIIRLLDQLISEENDQQYHISKSLIISTRNTSYFTNLLSTDV